MSVSEQTDSAEDKDKGQTVSARAVALGLLVQVLDKKMALDMALERDRGFHNLPVRDRAFVRMAVGTTLRRLGQIDDFIARALDKKVTLNPPVLQHLLRLGAAQIAFMNVPDYAVVDTSVRLAVEQNLSRQKGLINAVLRRVTENHKEWEAKQDFARMNIPDWLLKCWIADYGLSEAANIAQASLSEAPLDISLKSSEEASYWEGVLEATRLPSGTLRRIGGGDVRQFSGFDDGMWWVQDAAAALPAMLLGDVSGKEVVDMCAAPGGKTAQLAAAGANVIALDRSSQRLKKLDENMKRLRLDERVKTQIADAGEWTTKTPPTHILLDAPCTATGTIRRHPDVLALKHPRDLDRLVEIQRKILSNACDLLAQGGILVYCTCSLQKAEGEEQIAWLLSARPDMQRVPVQAEEIGGLATLINEAGDVRVLPYHMAAQGGMDGFFAARLMKT
jgi:16S rRNA (cytosine967-C5)-methyltransferase